MRPEPGRGGLDVWSTPPCLIRALTKFVLVFDAFDAERFPVWEPGAGDGVIANAPIAKRMQRCGYQARRRDVGTRLAYTVMRTTVAGPLRAAWLRAEQTDLVPCKGQFRSRFHHPLSYCCPTTIFRDPRNRHRHHLSATLLHTRPEPIPLQVAPGGICLGSRGCDQGPQ